MVILLKSIKMKLHVLIILSIFLAIQGAVVKNQKTEEDEKKCVDPKSEIHYERKALKTNLTLDRPYLLAADHETNILYFSSTIGLNPDEYQSALIDMNSVDADTTEFMNITEVKGGFAQTVDPKTHKVYIGGSDGIYTYDRKTNKTELYAAKGKNIYSLFYKDVLYFTEFPEEILYVYAKGNATRFQDLEDTTVKSFLIDKENDMFFTNATGFYKQKIGIKEAILLKTADSLGFRGINTDLNGNVYLCNHNGIYAVVKAKALELKKVLDIDDAFGVAFDKNNDMVYSDATSIWRRTKKNETMICNETEKTIEKHEKIGKNE